MSCTEVRRRITDLVFGEVEAEERAALEAHLAGCAGCASEKERIAATVALLREAAPAGRAEDRLPSDARTRLQAAARAPRSPRFPAWLAAAASLAAIGLATALTVPSLMRVSPGPEPAKAPALSPPETRPPALPVGGEQVAPPTVEPRVVDAGLPGRPAPPSAIPEAESRPQAQAAPEPRREAEAKRKVDDRTASDAAFVAPVEVPGGVARRAEEVVAGGVPGGVVGGVVGAIPDVQPASPAVMSKGERAQANQADRRGLPYDVERRLHHRPRPAPSPDMMYFESQGTNPFVVTAEDRFATFGLDVDTASYTLTRNYLGRGMLPPRGAVRVEEFVNAFPDPMPAPRDEDFAFRVEAAPNPLHEGYHVLRVALRAREVRASERKPARLTFVIDVSGSMGRENRLELVKRSLGLLVDKLDERDRIGIVVYGSNGRRVLDPTPLHSRERILHAIERLHPEGSTNLDQGLELGYEMAQEMFRPGASNRVVLCTDGVANTGITDADALIARIRRAARGGIDLMALGFGMGNYNDALLQRLADEGNGQYAYIDDFGQARAFFLRRLTSVLEVVARDAKAQVELDPRRVERYRLLGYEKRDIADEDFRNDRVDAGELNSGHAVTALFEVKLTGRGGRIGTARIRYKKDVRGEAVEIAQPITDAALAPRYERSSPAFQVSYVAARFAEHLRRSYWVKGEPLSRLVPLAEELPESAEARELADLVRRAARLAGGGDPE